MLVQTPPHLNSAAGFSHNRCKSAARTQTQRLNRAPCARTRATQDGLDAQQQEAFLPNSSRRRAVLADIAVRVQRLGAAALLPGNPAEKEKIDEDLRLLEQLQKEDDTLRAFRQESPSLLNDTRLLGSWSLVYASNGTAVTRVPGVQALVAASQLPGIGMAGITQQLKTDREGFIQASNEAEFGLGPFGTWSVAIIGKWLPGGSNMAGDSNIPGQGVKVVFERLKIRPVGLLGVPLPTKFPEALLSLGGADMERTGADWFTTYLDEEFRIGRGRTGNTFLFQKNR